METKIYIKELPCYQKKGNASEKKLRVMERHFYNLGLLATEGQQKEMEAFIRSQGKELSLVTVEDVAKLIQKSMEYTYERYGETEYIFVNESNPSLPFQYSMLKHRMYALIHENDICKDNGERMGFATHLFRHCYGMKLVEMHLDDIAIAHLLGHRGVSTVYRYRRASGKLMVKETEELRKTMDEILSEIIKEWDGYEQVFQNG